MKSDHQAHAAMVATVERAEHLASISRQWCEPTASTLYRTQARKSFLGRILARLWAWL